MELKWWIISRQAAGTALWQGTQIPPLCRPNPGPSNASPPAWHAGIFCSSAQQYRSLKLAKERTQAAWQGWLEMPGEKSWLPKTFALEAKIVFDPPPAWLFPSQHDLERAGSGWAVHPCVWLHWIHCSTKLCRPICNRTSHPAAKIQLAFCAHSK